MNDVLIAQIQSFTLQARADLERETEEQLEGLYGWLPNGTFALADSYPALQTLAEARETRARLERYADDEAEVGFDAQHARRKLVREAAFTWLNRLVAFKMLESRRLLKTLLASPERSNAYLFWLADGHDPEAHRMHQAGDTPMNALGEGPRQTAYRRFLLWQCAELARDVSVLFDPETLASRLCPRPNALRILIDCLNATDLTDAWVTGNEESIGWIYEGFIENENAAVFNKFKNGKKVLPGEIAAATQRFTPKWIVRFLVQNSLGRLWLEMHPDSSLKNRLDYYIPPAGGVPLRTLRPVQEIRFLDPSCGSMHFGLLAFDLLVEMYREEREKAGLAGWPKTPSVASEEEIPSAILTNNLYGIDLDPRAVQISALALLVKARGIQPRAKFTDHNLACCNVEAITGGRLEKIIQGARFAQPVHERILRNMVARLKDSDSLGSLLRPERDLERLIEEERARLKRDANILPGMGKSDLYHLDSAKKRESFFAGLAEEIARQLDEFVRRSRDAGQDEGHWVSETAKGLNFLRLVQQRYDIVVTNPPYMSRRNMSDTMAQTLDIDYSNAKGDLYAAFIVRCVELANPYGLVGMVTQQSFMFISSFEGLRHHLRSEVSILTMIHLGPRAFPNITGEKVNTTAFILERQPDEKQRDQSIGIYFRLVKERDAEAKRLAFESALANLQSGRPNSQIFKYRQSNFDAVPNNPWVYWFINKALSSFLSCPKVGDIATTAVGQNTGDNFRFLRFWWEVGKDEIPYNCKNIEEAIRSGRKWFPYMKGGTPIRWWGNQSYCVNWANDGLEVKALAVIRNKGKHWSRYLQNLEFLFQRGVTWSDISTKGFAVRLSPGGFIHDVKGMGCYPKKIDENLILGILNSKFSIYVLSALNPTISYQAGDVRRLPILCEQNQMIVDLVLHCIELTRQDSQENETTFEFLSPLCKAGDGEERNAQIHSFEFKIDTEVSRLYGLSNDDLAAINLELSNVSMSKGDNDEENANEEEEQDAIALSIPQEEISRRWISYAIGAVLGRFEIGVPGGLGCGDFPEAVVVEIRKLLDNDGIMPCEAGSTQDIAARALACLNLMLGVDSAHQAIHSALGEGDPLDTLRGWLERFSGSPAQSFWRYHFQQYRKRPIYWPFQSPERRYTVWVFHERLGPDTLFRLRNEFVEPRLRLAEREIVDLRERSAKDRKAAKKLDRVLDLAEDLRKFAANIKSLAERGYTPRIDDGVLLNAAPLHEILPSWPDTRAAWKELEQGKYDWAHQAMDHWPDRVREACRNNRSFAIAHGLVEIEMGGEHSAQDVVGKGKRKKR